MKERYSLVLIIGVFWAAYYVPWADPLVRQSGLVVILSTIAGMLYGILVS